MQDYIDKRDEYDGLIWRCYENDIFVNAVYCIACAHNDNILDLSTESSGWNKSITETLYLELRSIGLINNSNCGKLLLKLTDSLNNGTPIIGSEIKTDWAYYSIFNYEDIDSIIPCLHKSISHIKEIPEILPDSVKNKMLSRLTKHCVDFTTDLIKYFTQIKNSEMDCFILWY
jgi:hypothetical protein